MMFGASREIEDEEEFYDEEYGDDYDSQEDVSDESGITEA